MLAALFILVPEALLCLAGQNRRPSDDDEQQNMLILPNSSIKSDEAAVNVY